MSEPRLERGARRARHSTDRALDSPSSSWLSRAAWGLELVAAIAAATFDGAATNDAAAAASPRACRASSFNASTKLSGSAPTNLRMCSITSIFMRGAELEARAREANDAAAARPPACRKNGARRASLVGTQRHNRPARSRPGSARAAANATRDDTRAITSKTAPRGL